MRPDSDDAAYVADMLRYAEEVVGMTRGKTVEQFLADRVLQLAVERAVEVIGEAARHVSKAFCDAHPEIPWFAITKQRHVLAHDYGEIIPTKIWRVATHHVPELLEMIRPLVPPLPLDPEPPTQS